MAVISMKALLESGVHFGHRTNKWDPRMKPFIFTERNGIHIIDLQQTVKCINNAYAVLRDSVANGGTVLFVGTKRQAQDTVREEAMRAGMPYVTERWLGGMLTNWNTMRARIVEMERLEQLRDSGEINRLTKKEGLLIEREITRLNTRLDGVRSMKGLPDVVFIVDVGREDAAVHECNILNIPIVALVDTNCNPDGVDYVIPSNDDAIRAIKLLVGKMADAALEGRAMRKDIEPEMEAPVSAETASSVKRQAHPPVETEVELADDALLGESTLAKLGPKAEAETEPVAEVASTDVTEALSQIVPEPVEPAASAAAPAAAPAEEPAAKKRTRTTEKPAKEAEKPAAKRVTKPKAK
jgi:small subunit ribosomal protein S2